MIFIKRLLILLLTALLLVGCGGNPRVNKYDSDGHLIKEYFYTESGVYDGWGDYTYEDGNEVRLDFYDAKGHPTMTYEFEYDSGGNKTKTRYWLYDENCNKYGEYEYETLK